MLHYVLHQYTWPCVLSVLQALYQLALPPPSNNIQSAHSNRPLWLLAAAPSLLPPACWLPLSAAPWLLAAAPGCWLLAAAYYPLAAAPWLLPPGCWMLAGCKVDTDI